jgi:putative phosphoribosyl transferase
MDMRGFHEFLDRSDAGRQLARALASETIEQPLVLAIPRGGVPVGAEIAAGLEAELDLLFVRKIGAPWNKEVAIGAVAGTDKPQTVFNSDIVAASGATQGYIDSEVASQLSEINRQQQTYLGHRKPIAVEGRNVIVTDDGVATGATLAAGLKALRMQGVASITIAIPVAPSEAIELLANSVDRLICLYQPEDFRAVGLHYRHFDQVSDHEVIDALKRNMKI